MNISNQIALLSISLYPHPPSALLWVRLDPVIVPSRAARPFVQRPVVVIALFAPNLFSEVKWTYGLCVCVCARGRACVCTRVSVCACKCVCIPIGMCNPASTIFMKLHVLGVCVCRPGGGGLRFCSVSNFRSSAGEGARDRTPSLCCFS